MEAFSPAVFSRTAQVFPDKPVREHPIVYKLGIDSEDGIQAGPTYGL